MEVNRIRRFLLKDRSPAPIKNNMYGHIMVASDGECWEIFHSETFPYEQVIEVPYIVQVFKNGDRCCVPDWNLIGFTPLRKLLFRQPFAVVSELWGKEVALNHLDPMDDQKIKKIPKKQE